MIQREPDSGYWDDPVEFVERGKIELNFLDFFDWNCLDYRDFQYYRVLHRRVS